jgi:AraC family transcriptional regulator
MNTPPRYRALIHRIVGQPDISCRVESDPCLILERHHALFDKATIPPLPAPVIFVHFGGRPLSYRAGSVHATQESLPGLVTLVPPGVRAEIALRGIGEGGLVYFEDERHIPARLAECFPKEPLTFLDGVIASLTRQILAAAAAAAGRAEQAYLARLADALLAQLQHALMHSLDADPPRGSRSTLLVAHIAMRHIRDHLERSITLRDLAGECGLGVTHFSRAFKQATGVTPHRYVRSARIERACELLQTTSLTIGEVAEAVGFRGQSHFSTAFTQERGITPSAYRRRLHSGSR